MRHPVVLQAQGALPGLVVDVDCGRVLEILGNNCGRRISRITTAPEYLTVEESLKVRSPWLP